jgi:N-acetylmuramoyl-L-alanine amidase
MHADLRRPRIGWLTRLARSSAAVRLGLVALVILVASTASISPAITQTIPNQTRIAATIDPRTPAGPPVAVPMISDMRVATLADHTTVRLATTNPVTVETFSLSEPYRVVLDMPEARFDLGSVPREPRGAIKSWRAGLFATGRSRLVFDTTGPIRVLGWRLEARGDGRSDVVIDLLSITAQQFDADERARREARLAAIAAERIVPDTLATDPAAHRLIVVLDPGHGGIDAGTVSPHTGMPEKQVVLEFARLLEKKLAETGRYQVFLTRTDDTFVPLGDRVKFARAHHADLLVSIHADAELDRSVRGSTVFTRSEKASDAKAAALAAKENQSDALAGLAVDEKSDEVADILIDLVKRETHAFSHALAERLVDALSKSGHMVKQDPHRSGQLRVLNAYDFPSVLIELGFLSNKDDEAELVSPKWRVTTATSVVAAIDRFFATRDALAPK